MNHHGQVAGACQGKKYSMTLFEFLHLTPCDFPVIIEEARRLSDRYTLAGGHRSFDILHVATARIVKATTFLSFDANQRKLAGAVGLTVAPHS
jgi:predicted nucleic acid-binding protein